MNDENLLTQHTQLLEVEKMRMPLIMLSEGAKATVIEVHGGRSLCRRLAEMGFNVGDRVLMIKNHRPGPVMVEVKDSRVALGRGVTMKIIVEEN
ncbi:MAG: ferrous iron transport protein A [Candidatus Bathyarchaeota archaeon]|nr:ferrous iron transport protein A [Candidatus Bathyarchaeota archaeon]